MSRLACVTLIIFPTLFGCSVIMDKHYSNNSDSGVDAGYDSDIHDSSDGDENNCECALAPHVEEVECIDQQCEVILCEENYYDYDGNYQNGCEKFCDCDLDNANSHCDEDGDCVFDGCFDNYWNNNEDLSDGCEHTCECDLPHAASHCEESNGECILDSCIQNYFDIDGELENGCEHFCDCVGLPQVVSSYCSTSGENIGDCVIEQCEAGYCNTDDDSSTGCESSC